MAYGFIQNILDQEEDEREGRQRGRDRFLPRYFQLDPEDETVDEEWFDRYVLGADGRGFVIAHKLASRPDLGLRTSDYEGKRPARKPRHVYHGLLA